MKKLLLVLLVSRGLFFINTKCISIREYITKHGMPALSKHILDLSKKKLTSLEGLEDIPNLNLVIHLKLNGNKLQSLPANIFDNLAQLRVLDLKDNKLQTFPSNIFDNLAQLQALALNANQMQSLPATIFGNLAQLRGLGLSYNQLQTLPPDIFNNLAQLQALDLSNNQLQTLPAHIFDNLAQLLLLNLSHNQLQSLPVTAFNKLAQLRVLDLNSNKLEESTQQFRKTYLAYNAYVKLSFKHKDQEKAEKVYQKYFAIITNLTAKSEQEKVVLLQELQACAPKNIFHKALSWFQKLLPKQRNLVLTRDSNGNTLLHKAILLEDPLIVQQVSQLWPELLVAKNNQGRTALHSTMALQNRFLALAITKVLLAATDKLEALLAIQDNNGDMPIRAAISNHQFRVLQFLLMLGYDYNSSKLEHKINKIYSN